MSLLRLKLARVVLLEDDVNKNTVPLLKDLFLMDNHSINFFCFEQPIFLWRSILKEQSNIKFHENIDTESLDKYTTEKCSIIVDSVNQMSLCLGWDVCLRTLKKLISNSNVNKLILVLHKDCLTPLSKMRMHLNHISNEIITYDEKSDTNIHITIKKTGKVMRSFETLSYDTKTSTLKSQPIIKEETPQEETVKPSPENLSTFKIEVSQQDKVEKYKVQLPYMSKIHEGQGKIIYEPDAVDDWDEEDPDEDLDI